MAEMKLPRLMAAAKEFNIGKDELTEFLVSKGFPKDELKPTSKLTEEMYRALQQEFQADKAKHITSSDSKVGWNKSAQFTIEDLHNLGKEKVPELEILIDPGTAPNEEVASILADLSLVFRQMGGSGIEFKLDHVSIKQNELA